MTDFPTYPVCPQDSSDESSHRRQIAVSARAAVNGKTNNVGEVTLTANAATTVVVDPRVSVFSCIVFEPVTANAAAELYGATMYVLAANKANGQFTITHANDANADKTFRYTVVG